MSGRWGVDFLVAGMDPVGGGVLVSVEDLGRNPPHTHTLLSPEHPISVCFGYICPWTASLSTERDGRLATMTFFPPQVRGRRKGILVKIVLNPLKVICQQRGRGPKKTREEKKVL